MSTLIQAASPLRAPDRSSLPSEGGELRFLIYDLDWAGFLKLLDLFQDSGPRMAYLNGVVELMTTGARHERFKKVLGRMVEDILVELCIPANALGSMTFTKQSIEHGVEPDECYYIANVNRLEDEEKIDLEGLPPPDLIIEVEITSPLLEKLAIYAGLRVPELWRYNGRTFTLLLLQPDGSYAVSSRSRAFPFLPMDTFTRFLSEYDPKQETRWALAYRTWVREVVAPLYPH